MRLELRLDHGRLDYGRLELRLELRLDYGRLELRLDHGRLTAGAVGREGWRQARHGHTHGREESLMRAHELVMALL